MPECAHCGGEIYRYDEVYGVEEGIVHYECLYGYMKERAKPLEDGVCEQCGERFEDDGVTALEAAVHEDCLLDYVWDNCFSWDFGG